MRHELPEGLIFTIALDAGMDVPAKGAKRPVRCPFHDDRTASAFLSERNCFFCSVCTSDHGWSARRFCEKSGLNWQSYCQPTQSSPPWCTPRRSARDDSGPSFSPADAELVWSLSRARARDDAAVDDDRPVYDFLIRRGLMEGWEAGVAGVLPPGRAVPQAIARWHARHYRLVVPLYDGQGDVVNVQARAVVDVQPKTRFPAGSRIAGSVFADARGRELLRGEREPESVLFGEGLTDLLAMAICSPVPVLAAPGVSHMATAVGTWIRGRTLLLAVDNDDAGEAVVADVSAAAFDRGASRVRRIVWPDHAKDACDVVDRHGVEGLAAFLASVVEEMAS